MKKQLRNIIISLCVVLVLVVGVVVASIVIKNSSNTSSSSSTSSSEGIPVVKLNEGDITELNVKTTDNEYTIKKSGSNYVIDGIETSLLSQDSLTTPVTTFSDFEALKLIEDNASDLSQYGLDKPTRTITATTADKTVTLLVGKETPLKDGFYGCLKGETKVYKISENIITQFDKTNFDFINLSLYSVDTSKSDDVSLLEFGGTARKTPIVLEQRETGSTSSTSSDSVTKAYFLKVPMEYSTDADKSSGIVTTISNFSAGGVLSLDVSDANLEKYGLKNPSYTFSVTNSGKKTTFRFGKAYDEDGTKLIPVYEEGRNCIYKMADTDDAFYKYELTDLATSLLYTEFIDTVKEITVNDNGTSYTFALSGTGDDLVADYKGTKLTTDNLRELYKSIVGIGVEGQTTDKVSGSAYATVNIKFREASKKDVTMKFIKMDSRRSYWSYNGRVDFYVLNSEINQMLQITKDFAAGKTVTYN